MQKIALIILSIAINFHFTSKLSAINEPTPPWGFFGHKKLNKLAVFTLPPEMIRFYKEYMEYISVHAVDPDKRRYASKYEGIRHFIDLDQYGKPPFEDLPKTWTDALGKFSQLIIIDYHGDSIQITSDKYYKAEKGKVFLFHPNIKKIFKVDTIKLKINDFRHYISSSIAEKFYDEDWTLSVDSLQKLFNPYPLVATKCIVKETFSEHGILPYFLPQILNRLTDAFKEKNVNKIIKLSAEIGHYIGDAHVPLHTTSNYNGQKTDQVGIHGFWESRLPELFADDQYDFFVGTAKYMENPNKEFWQMVYDSNSYVDSVLLIEKKLKEKFPEDNQFCFDDRLGVTVRTQCKEFALAYHDLLKGQVEDRMRSSVLDIGSAWFTAWVNAGQPDLNLLLNEKIITSKEEDENEKAFQKGQIIGRPEDH